MKYFEVIIITIPIIVMLAIIINVIAGLTLSDFEIFIAVIISGLVSWMVAYYFHKKDTPAQQTWNEKRRETIEDMTDLFEQLSRQVRVGSHIFDKAIQQHGYNQQTVQNFIASNQTAINKMQKIHKLIFDGVDRNYNYLTNKETRKFKFLADTLVRYLEMKIKRPENYLDELKYLENERTIKQELEKLFEEVDSSKKDFLKRGLFEFSDDDINPRWENTHTY